jgi:uncharacterized membrane protein
MIRKNLKVLVITSIVILLPILAGLLLWNQLPEKVPSHWNAAGEVDGWSSKGFTVFGMPLILLAAQWLCVLATAADPKSKNHSGKMLQLVLWIMPVITTVLHVITYAVALGQQVQVEVVMPILLGLVFIIIGNYMPKCKQNYTIGIKIPWTLDSEENWNRTHRMAGRIWVVCGFLMILTAFSGIFWLFFIFTIPMVFGPLLYSYILHKKGI